MPGYEYENELCTRGYTAVCGVDEAGRGPLCGPVVAAAVILPPGLYLEGLNDSKKLSEKKREALFPVIQKEAIAFAVASASPAEIDELNILNATMLAMRRAISALSPAADFALIDGNTVRNLPVPAAAIVKGDSLSCSIAAASILAKTHRDLWMERAAENYPEYAFEVHKGYGTELHLERLRRFGCCPLHRKSFAPVRQILHPPVWIQGDLF